jgi:hypothetical protein
MKLLKGAKVLLWRAKEVKKVRTEWVEEVVILEVKSTEEVFGKKFTEDGDLREWYEMKPKGCSISGCSENQFELRSDGKVWLKDNWSKGRVK